jgi:hypothetical protein
LEDIAITRIHNDILEKLSKQDRELFYQVNEHRDAEKIRSFLEEKLPEYHDVVQDATRSVAQDFMRLQTKKQ